MRWSVACGVPSPSDLMRASMSHTDALSRKETATGDVSVIEPIGRVVSVRLLLRRHSATRRMDEACRVLIFAAAYRAV